MAQPTPSVYRDALQVSPERIAAMTDAELKVLCRQLLEHQAYKCGMPVSEIRVNTEDKAKDGGSDGWSARPAAPDDWLGFAETCWQFKSGKAGQPARLAGEVLKPVPTEILRRGGRFVVVASGSTNGITGENDRLKTLKDEATEAGIPATRIKVIGSEQLATWCNENPAIAARWAGRPSGLLRLDEWVRSEEHQVSWQASEGIRSAIEASRHSLDFLAGDLQHLHIQGPPGVGKTRLALELCRDAAWSRGVIYIRQAADVRLSELIDSAAADTGTQFTIVADEVQSEQIQPLRDSVERCEGRVRLVTIGHTPTPDLVRIPSLKVEPLGPVQMRQVICGWVPNMPREHVDFVVDFADGYVRLAKLAADAICQNKSLTVRQLFDRDDIRSFLDRMLGSGTRRALYVVAALSNIGWSDDKQVEGKAVAQLFGLDWNEVRESVEDFHRRLNIAPQGGRYRYISPRPLGDFLAAEAWTTFPDVLRAIPENLPSDESRDAYYERLTSMTSNAHARAYAREELTTFSLISHFAEIDSVRRWSAFSAADPLQAARSIRKSLEASSVDDRLSIQGRARREVVWALVRFAWKQSAFHDAVWTLALLAEAENERWANNATSEFVSKYQIWLGGTAVPYPDRLAVIDEMIEVGRPSLTRIAVEALSQVGNRHASRSGQTPSNGELPELEWRPKTGSDYLGCCENAVCRIVEITERQASEFDEVLVEAATKLTWMFGNADLRPSVERLFRAIREKYPRAREPLRRAIADVIHHEKKFARELSAEDLAQVEVIHSEFDDSSVGAQLRQHIGTSPWERCDQPDFTPLAETMLSTQELLREHWPWLTSGEAVDGWRFGEALAIADSNRELDEVLPLLPNGGRDLRIVCGYVSERRRRQGDGWYDSWMRAQAECDPKRADLLTEVAGSCGATESLAESLAELLRGGFVGAEAVGRLAFGNWASGLSVNSLEAILNAMLDAHHGKTAIGILEHRLTTQPSETSRWMPTALRLVTDPEVIRGTHMASYHWKEVASRLVSDHSREIAEAIFRTHADRELGEYWNAEHKHVAEILRRCVESDPTGIWSSLEHYLTPPKDAQFFVIGFPQDVLSFVPNELVMDWVAQSPLERACTLSQIVDDDLSTDTSLMSRILGKYGNLEHVAGSYLSAYIAGIWSGPSSTHWEELAERLKAVAERTALPKLRRWANDSSDSLRNMAERDRVREEEEEIRDHV